MDDTLTIRSGKSGKYHHHHFEASDYYNNYNNNNSNMPPSSSACRLDTATRRPYTASTLGGDESEWDVDLRSEERRLMPMFGKKVPPTGNTNKALKLLGLA
jgi:hypothetical protein